MEKNRIDGFTLVEVVVGMLVFAIIATTSSVAFVQTQKLAHSNVMHNTARTVLQGYVEQIKGIQYFKLLESIEDPTAKPIGTKSISSLTEGDEIQLDDSLFLNQENHKNILLDIVNRGNGVREAHTMDLYVTPTATNILNTAGMEVIEFKLDYRYDSAFNGLNAEQTGTIRFIKTSISEY
jgi:prepilin-type N-terminal cleavage/methylation domain-containing protein